LENKILEILGAVGSLILVGTNIPQIVKILKTNKADDVSELTYWFSLVGCGLLIPYAILTNNKLLVINYGTSCLTFICLLFLIRKYRTKDVGR
jgi:uncharacterized protein with PQ loop repeat